MPRNGRRTREQYLQDMRELKMRRALSFLERMTDGLNKNEVAALMYVQPCTVKANLCWLYERLGASTNAQAVAICFRKGLLK